MQAIEAAQVAKAAQQQQGHPLDASAFLGTCSSEELKTMRMLAHLCNQTYYMGQLTVSWWLICDWSVWAGGVVGQLPMAAVDAVVLDLLGSVRALSPVFSLSKAKP